MECRSLNSIAAYVAYKKADSRRPSIDLIGRVKDSTKDTDKKLSSDSKDTNEEQAPLEGKRKKGKRRSRTSVDLRGRDKGWTKALAISVSSGSKVTKEDQISSKPSAEKTVEK